MPQPMRASLSVRRPCRALIVASLVALALSACSEEHAQGGAIDVEATFGEVGRFPGQLVFPRAMSTDGQSLVVIDKTARIQRFDAKTGDFIDGVRTPELELGKPTGLCVAPHPIDPARKALYVADTHYHRVLVYDLESDLNADPSAPLLPDISFGEYGTGPGQFVYPTDVAVLVDADGSVSRLFVSEYGGNDRITIFDVRRGGDAGLTFEPTSTFGAFGIPGEDESAGLVFNRPQSLVLDRARGELLVCDACNHRIGRFTLEGELIAWTGSPDNVSGAPGSLRFPYALALLEDGTALVSEFGSSHVQHMNLDTGESLGIYGEAGRGAGQLATPWAVQVIGKTAYVLDSGNDRIIAFRSPARGAGGAQ